MNLLIDSKLCVTPHRITIDYDPDSPERVEVTAVVIEGDDCIIRQRRRSSRRAYRSAPPSDLEPCILRFAAPAPSTPSFVDVTTPFGLRRDYCLDGEALYSEYLTKAA